MHFIYILFLFVKTENNFKKIKHVLYALYPGKKLLKVCENSEGGENPRLHLRFSLISSQILSNICLSFH